jgi:N-acetylneuraminic acid mutarotase
MNRKAQIAAAVFAVLLEISALQVFLVHAGNSDSWAAKKPVPMASWGVASVNDKIYLIAAGNEDNAVLEYDPFLDSWTVKKPMLQARYSFVTAVCENRIYVIGEPGGINQVYDPATDTWENKKLMPTHRTQLEANVVKDKIYLIGGLKDPNTGEASDLNEVYDPATDTWTTKTPIPTPVFSYASAVCENRIYFIGGSDSGSKLPNLNQVYDPATDTWSLSEPIPTPVVDAAAGATSGKWAPKRIYVIGGRINYGLEGSSLNQVYNPENDSWSVGEPMPTARFNLAVAVVNDKLYAMGGTPYFNLEHIWSRENEEYTPIGYGTVPPVVAVVSPESRTYNVTSVSLVFMVNKPVVWMGYRLDGQEAVKIGGNTTITGLTSGVHNITVYAKDEFENMGNSETVWFSIPEPFPSAWIAAAVAILVISGAALVIYFAKARKTRLNPNE